MERSAKPRMCFPSLQQNASPLGLLSSYICVLGKKIDLAESVKELVHVMICTRKPRSIGKCCLHP